MKAALVILVTSLVSVNAFASNAVRSSASLQGVTIDQCATAAAAIGKAYGLTIGQGPLQGKYPATNELVDTSGNALGSFYMDKDGICQIYVN